jgi:hypothetical protein
MLILLIFFPLRFKSKQATSRLSPIYVRKPGPQGTIAKEKGERKEKSQKRLEKCKFLCARVEITAKTAGYKRFQRSIRRL